MKQIKIIPIRLVGDNTDTDMDGVPNYRDCQPFNPNKHGIWLRCPRCSYLFSTMGVDPFGRLKEPIEKSRFLRCPKCSFADAPRIPFLRLKGPGYGGLFQKQPKNNDKNRR